MAQRIEVRTKPKISDGRAKRKQRKIERMGFSVDNVCLADIYTVDVEFLTEEQLQEAAEMLTSSVTEESSVGKPLAPETFDWAIEVGYLPGVKDNVAGTATEGIEDLLKVEVPHGEGIYTSQVMFISGGLSREEAESIASSFANPVIQRKHVKSAEEFRNDGGMDVIVPKVKGDKKPKTDIVDILGVDDLELQRIGKMGVFDHNNELAEEKHRALVDAYEKEGNKLMLGDLFEEDGKFLQKVRRGPLALVPANDLSYMHTIRDYFKEKGRNPTDLEMESIAQTWSEHCKHTIFADPIDDIAEGLYNRFIKGATRKIRKAKGDKDFCVSVFTDNSGAIIFDENWLVTSKIETHNSPSALDPYGGAITGIVGVYRDAIGFGLGAKPFSGRYGFCFADPEDKTALFKGVNNTQPMLTAGQIMDGVIDGVRDGGNCSGNPTPQGFLRFDPRYRGKPLVFVGVDGVIPRESAGRPSHEKKADAGDLIVMVGGRVGKDGIHGATFSSEALDTGSPMGAVQIGDPITQKKMSDALVKEARDMGLYTSITDNGAGGLSCSVAEMAKESGGCRVDLEKVPLKYDGLDPWEIWISESQERMTLSVPKEKWGQFSDLMRRRGVEATVIGEFTDSGKCVVDFNGENVMDVDMDFLHDGLPPRPMTTTYTRPVHEEPEFAESGDLTGEFHKMLNRLNIASWEFISEQFDHEVQGGSVIKPLQGRGKVNGDATVTRPVLESKKGFVASQGINPSYSDIDTYHMAACAIDTAIRNSIAVGADLDYLALMDNFCWCSSDDPERLGQLKAAAEACHDYAVEYGTPFISGKDSMFNDFKGYDEDGNPVKISVPPTLLVSTSGVMEDAAKAVSLDAKFAGDLVYVLGETHDELGGSEYFSMKGEEERGERFIGNAVPKVDAKKNAKVYRAFHEAVKEEIVASAQSAHLGGVGMALAKTAMGGKLGMEISMEKMAGDYTRNDFGLFSESQGRIVVTVAPENRERFEKLMEGNLFSQVGVVTGDGKFTIKGKDGKEIVKTDVNNMAKPYKARFEGY